MKFLVAATLLAVASAFTSQPSAFQKTANVVPVDRVAEADEPVSHRNRKATIVMDGKANGTYVRIDLNRFIGLVYLVVVVVEHLKLVSCPEMKVKCSHQNHVEAGQALVV